MTASRLTAEPLPYRIAPDQAADLPWTYCLRCGAVGTHYLTCPDLRLPSGYRLSDASGPE